jgi:formyltetrahydrofolate deformylase
MLVSCPDKPGIIAAVSRFLFERGVNILDFDQHASTGPDATFFLRLEFELENLPERLEQLRAEFRPLAEQMQMQWRMTPADRRRKMAIFVSRQDHCLIELLWRWRAGELPTEISMVVSNHPDLRADVEGYGIPFHHVPVTPQTREAAADQALGLLEGSADLIVLARYMQILPAAFCARYPGRIINIHHSFLPAFIGANPYERAFERGVKLIGATAHYVTADLDEGPIIEQDVQRVGHRHEAEDLKRIGREVERAVLARAVSWHLEDRVLVQGNKTVVFR